MKEGFYADKNPLLYSYIPLFFEKYSIVNTYPPFKKMVLPLSLLSVDK